MKKVITVKNFLPRSLHNLLKSKVYSNSFPWFYAEDITGQSSDNTNGGFSHTLFDGENLTASEFYKEFIPIYACMHDISGINPKDLLRMRIGFLTPREVLKCNNPHVDYNKNHFTALYYFDNSDGDTYIFNERCTEQQTKQPTIFETVRPEENKLVIFDGTRFHSSSNPNKFSRRTVLTINFE